MIRVFLVDDHELVRRGIAQLIDFAPDIEIVGEADSVRGALDRVAATMPDIVVLDVQLPDGSGIDLCRSIRSAHPGIRCLMLTGFDDDTASVAAVIAGSSGYVMKNIRGRSLIEGIRRVARGETLMHQRVVDHVRSSLTSQVEAPLPASVEFTLRERQALSLITEGLTNRQIGERLGLAEKTVKNYVSGLLAKLGMERRTQVAAYGATAKARSTDAQERVRSDHRPPRKRE
jgi:DNA-binding NarL/FixJ family response regulator